MFVQNQERGISRCSCNSSLANSTLVSDCNESTGSETSVIAEKCPSPSLPPESNSSSKQQSLPSCVSIIRSFFRSRGLSKESIDILCKSWRSSTARQYEIYFKKWHNFCTLRNKNPFQYDEILVVEFLVKLFHTGLKYSAINTARSALSTFLVNDFGLTIGNSPIVKRLLKGVFEMKPPLARYSVIWDVNIVLDYLRHLYPNEELPLSILTFKLAMLLALVTKQRAQTLQALSVSDMRFFGKSVIIPVRKLLKHSTQRNHNHVIQLTKFNDSSICSVVTLEHYLSRTNSLRDNHSQLFISYNKPYHPVSTDTISRWLKNVMFEAGIDVNMFKPHSTRAASTSYDKLSNVPMELIMKSAGWTNCKTFETFYNKAIISSDVSFE